MCDRNGSVEQLNSLQIFFYVETAARLGQPVYSVHDNNDKIGIGTD